MECKCAHIAILLLYLNYLPQCILRHVTSKILTLVCELILGVREPQ